MFGISGNNRSEGQGGCREALSTKEVCSKGTTVGTRTGSEAGMRAMSVLGNAKSNCHQKTHQVEPDGTGRKFMHLTRGELARESAGAVSRSRSSEEGRESRLERRAEGTGKRDQLRNPGRVAGSSPKSTGYGNYGRLPVGCRKRTGVDSPDTRPVRGASHGTGEPEEGTQRCAKQ